jgi:orotate phosphoribosyltransferase-like protein
MTKDELKKQGNERAAVAHEYRRNGLTYKEICEKMGVSYARARQLIEKAEYTKKKEWQWLTDEEMSEAYNVNYSIYKEHVEYVDFVLIYRVIEAKLKEKNT